MEKRNSGAPKNGWIIIATIARNTFKNARVIVFFAGKDRKMITIASRFVSPCGVVLMKYVSGSSMNASVSKFARWVLIDQPYFSPKNIDAGEKIENKTGNRILFIVSKLIENNFVRKIISE